MHGSSKPKNVNQNEKHAGTVRHNTIGDKVGVFKTRIVKEESFNLNYKDTNIRAVSILIIAVRNNHTKKTDIENVGNIHLF